MPVEGLRGAPPSKLLHSPLVLVLLVLLLLPMVTLGQLNGQQWRDRRAFCSG